MAVPPACRVCGGPLALARKGRAGGPTPAAFAPSCHETGAHGDLDRCSDCGTVQQRALPRGSQLESLYRDMRDPAYLDEEPGRRRTARRLLDLVAGHVPTGRLLDVGCGHGLLLAEAVVRGYDAQGLELSHSAAAHARDVLGLRVREVPVEDPALDGERFDVVVLADVLEHVDDPVGTLDRCTHLLTPGGALVIITPDPSSPTARLAGARWWGYLPAHVCLIPHPTLRELLIGRGLVVGEDVPFVRSFTPRTWISGLAERAGLLGRAALRWGDRLPAEAQWSLHLGDERVLVARRAEVLRPEPPLVEPRGGDTQVTVVLPAFKAAATVGQVAHEMPVHAADRALLVDDASPDATVEAALAAGFEVLVHPTNRGYGANQKTCYARAALDGADVVVMVHADNQYDPALVAQMVRPIVEGRADAVIGSRLLDDESIAGGMPRWKWVGNRGLTAIENLAFGREFSEYHTGFRAFSVDVLRRIAFARNADDFVFDQQIFAQLVATGARVVELPIPTRYFLEASSVSFRDSVVYGLKTLGVLVRFRLDRRRPWLLLRRPAIDLRPVASAARDAA